MTTSEPLPEYAATVAVLGDLQPTLDELSAALDATTPPKIMTTVLLQIHQGNDPGELDALFDEVGGGDDA